MADMTPAERERLAIEVMGCVKGWLLVPSAAPDNYLWFTAEKEAIQYRYEHNWIADVVEAYRADGHYILLADWLPDLPGHIEQAMGLLMAMNAKEYAVRIETYPRLGLGQYMVALRKGNFVRESDLPGVGPIAGAICRAVLAALEVK